MNFLLKIKTFCLLLSLMLVLVSCSSISSLNFWSNDNNDEVDVGEPKELKDFFERKTISTNWKISFEGDNYLGNFEPSFSGDSMYFADKDGNIRSIDNKTGQENWAVQTTSLSAGISSGFGVLAVSDIDGNVRILEQSNGNEIWSSNVKAEVLSKVAIDAKFIIVKTSSGELIALDKNTGDLKWSYRSKLPNLTIRGSSSPIIVENRVYATFDSGRLVVFDISSGFPVWDGAISYVEGSSEIDNLIDSDASPVISENYAYAINYQGYLNVFDLRQERTVWRSKISSFYEPVLVKKQIITIDSNSELKSFSQNSFSDSWSSDEYLYRELSNHQPIKGDIVVGDKEGYIHIIDSLTGETIGRKKISRKPIKTIYSRSNNFYVVDEAFNLFSLTI